MKISVCIAVRNGLPTLPRCVESILSQEYTNLEVLIQDARSTDGTTAYLDSLSDNRVRVVSEGDAGIADAWNRMLDRVQGDWILFLGCDDWLTDSTVLSKVSEELKGATSTLAVGGVTYIRSDGQKLPPHPLEWNRDYFFKVGMCFCHQGVFHSKRIFADGLRFDTSLKIASDYELLLKAALVNEPYLLTRIQTISSVGMDGLSHHDDKAFVVRKEYAKARKLNGLPSSWQAHWLETTAHLKRIAVFLLGKKRAKVFIDFLRPIIGRRRRDEF